MFEKIIAVIKDDFSSFSFFKAIYTLLVIFFVIMVFSMGAGYVVDDVSWWTKKD